MPLMNGISHGAETESIIRDEEDDNERGGGGGGGGGGEEWGNEGRSKAEASNSSMLHNRLMDVDAQ